MITFNLSDCALEMGVFVLGLGLNLYTVSEVAASVMISSIVLFTVGLALMGTWLIWSALNSVATWRRVASRKSALLTCLTAELVRPRTTE